MARTLGENGKARQAEGEAKAVTCPEDKEFKETIKNARKKLETPMARLRMENLYGVIMKTILQEKETIHCNITTWFTNLFPCLKQ